MKRFMLGIIPILVCLLFTGCKDDELVKKVQEGLPTSLTFRMTVPKTSDVNPMTRATDEVETNVEKLGLIFYKYEGSKGQVVQVKSKNITKTGSPSSTNYYYTITIDADQLSAAGIYTGTYANVFAIANWDKGFCTVTWSDLQDLTLEELKEYCVLKTNNQTDLIETALLLTGEYGEVTLQENGAVLSDFHLKRLTAKIEFNFISLDNINAKFTPKEYEIHNYSRSSTLIERTGWVNKDGTTTGSCTSPGSLTYTGREDEWAFASTTTPFQMTGTSFLFYMLENVQPAKENLSTGDSWSMREKRVGIGQHDTFKYAPEKGTYVVVRGEYSGRRGGTPENNEWDPEETVTGQVAYTIHLGDFSSETGSLDNYTVRRNTKYTYDVTVTGVNSIIVEASTTSFDEETNPAAEGSIMVSRENVFDLDAHFETAMLKLPTDVDVEDYTLLVNTPYGMYVHTRTSESEGTEVPAAQVEWVKFGKPASTSAFAAYPGDSKFTAGADAFKNNDTTNENAEGNVKLVDIYGLLELLKSNNSIYRDQFFVTGTEGGKTYYYVTAYVDENYYDDETDFSKFVNVSSSRKMALSSTTSVSPDKYSSYTVSPIFSLTQRPIYSPFDLGSTATLDGLRFGVETVEETGPNWLAGVNQGEPSVRNAPRMNWGWRNLWEQLDTEQFGEYELSKGGSTSNYPWNRYVNIATNGHFSNFNAANRINAMNSDYVYGLYQCFSRNRDENGDGYIDIQEMKWFLPAIQECTSIWSAGDALPAEARFTELCYFTSTNGQYRTWWASEGTAFGEYKPNFSEENQNHVRCIRILGKFGEEDNEVTASISNYDETNRVVNVHDLAAGTTRIAGSQMGEYTNHTLSGWQNRLPTAFQIASSDLSYTSGNSTKNTFSYSEILNGNLCADHYSEAADESDLGQWRIPNQRELTLMFRHYRATQGTLTGRSSLSDYTVSRTTFTRNEGNALYFVQKGTNQAITTSWDMTGTGAIQSSCTDFKIRCVRDYTSTSSAVSSASYDSSMSQGGKAFGIGD